MFTTTTVPKTKFFVSGKKLKFSMNDVFRAAKVGDLTLAEQALINSYSVSFVNRLDENSLSPVHYASQFNRAELIEILTKHNADVNVKGLDGITPLHVAAKYNSLDALQILLTLGAKLDAQDDDNQTPLHIAAKQGNVDICMIILNQNRSLIAAVDKDLLTPLHLACSRGKLLVCQLLIRNGANINAQAIDGSIPIHFAAIRGSVEVMQLLLDTVQARNLKLSQHLLESDYDGRTVIHKAVQGGNMEAVLLCLRNSADIAAYQRDGTTALHIAAAGGLTDIADALIQSFAPIEAKDNQGRTSLHLASMYGHLKVVKVLVENRARIDLVDDKLRTALSYAIEQGQLAVSKYLIREKANLHVADYQGRNYMHIAAWQNNTEIMAYLLTRGADGFINEIDKFERTPLHYAAEEGSYSAMETLLANKAALDITDADDNTPLHLACRQVSSRGDFYCVKLLCDKSLNKLNSPGERSRTPLHMAVIYDHLKVVLQLIKYGADINRRDGSYCTPLNLAASKGYEDIITVLLDAGANIDIQNSKRQTALHIAVFHGHTEIAKILIKRGSSLLGRDEENKSCLDIAIERNHEEIVSIIVKEKEGRQIMLEGGRYSQTPMQKIIAKLPDVALQVMQNCIERSCKNKNREDYSIEYDFTLLDPGPQFELNAKEHGMKKPQDYNSLKTMLQHQRLELIGHELSRALIDCKWRRYGLYISSTRLSSGMIMIQLIVIIFGLINFAKEISEMAHKGFSYFTSFSNYVEMSLYTTAFIFMFPFGTKPDQDQWLIGSIAIFLAWINLLLFSERINFFGIYVLMLKSVIGTFLMLVPVIIIFIIAFGFVFYIAAGTEAAFSTIGLSFIKVIDMMVGEIDYMDVFVTPISNQTIAYPHNILVLSFTILFIFLMPILLTNLMTGLAIGDIEEIKQNASLRRLQNQVEFLDDLERSMPLYFRRRLYSSNTVIYPNTTAYKVHSFINGRIIKVRTNDNSQDHEKFKKIHHKLEAQKQQLMIDKSLLNTVVSEHIVRCRIRHLNFQLEDILKRVSGNQIPQQRRESFGDIYSTILPNYSSGVAGEA
ncbi:Transient receptor potential cation channel subfamily A member 1 [Trichoplax sp. H2]|nr:Transient receptor potential cation channel subfamily A member 1 [Trichoplax sp. H2]|eukprot:RDD38699.1 Transient receptor potential cation channel subfamily A member 1 [Trichoplax sp. H2]